MQIKSLGLWQCWWSRCHYYMMPVRVCHLLLSFDFLEILCRKEYTTTDMRVQWRREEVSFFLSLNILMCYIPLLQSSLVFRLLGFFCSPLLCACKPFSSVFFNQRWVTRCHFVERFFVCARYWTFSRNLLAMTDILLSHLLEPLFFTSL